MRMVVQKNLFKSAKVGNQDLLVSCLQFADDTIFFGDASIHNILTLKSILRCFEIASGLRVNFLNSSLASVNIERTNLLVLADTLNCKLMEIPLTYLGLPVGANPRKLSTWKPVIERVKKWSFFVEADANFFW